MLNIIDNIGKCAGWFVTIIIIFMIIIVICIAIISGKRANTFGGFGYDCETSNDYPADYSDITGGLGDTVDPRDVYDHLAEYVDEVGDSKPIEEYLMTIHDNSNHLTNPPHDNISLDYETENAAHIKHKKLYQIIKNILRGSAAPQYENVNDFVFCNGIKYMWFLPADLRRELARDERLSAKLFTDYAIKTNLEKHLFPHSLSSAELNKLVDKVAGLSRLYVKFRPEVVKRLMKSRTSGGYNTRDNIIIASPHHLSDHTTGGTKKKSEKEQKSSAHLLTATEYKNSIAPDVLGFDAVLWQIASKIRAKLPRSAQKHPITPEQLADINLISMQYKDPVAVYNFIKRIKPVIKHIEEEYPRTEFGKSLGISPLTSDLLAEHRELMRAKWEREKAEAHKLRHELDIMRAKAMGPAEPGYEYAGVAPPVRLSSLARPIPPSSYPPPAPPYHSDSSPPDKPHLGISDPAIPPGLWDGGRMRGLEYFGGRTSMNNRTNIKKKLH